MIIDKNNFNNPINEANRFNNQFNKLKDENAKNNNLGNPFVNELSNQAHTNPINNNDMYDKSLAMLHERLKNGLITLEEFNKKCNIIGKKRQK